MVRLLRFLLVAVALFASNPPGAASHGLKDTEVPGIDVQEQLGARIPLDLTLRDESGRQVLLADLVSGPTIILPVYYSCTNVCNYLQGGLARILPALKNRPGSEYRIISVSFDENETPLQAARSKKMYLNSMNVPFPEAGWRFLTGDAGSIRRLTDAAGYRFERRGRDFIHPVVSVVVAGDGTIVRYLYGTTFLAKDVSMALLEARRGVAGTSIHKMVEYCFSFDPASKTYVFNLLRVSATVVIICTGSFLAFLLLGGRKRKQDDSEKKS
jgi:protein SCO1/2